MASRVLALLAAVAMVAGALVFRSHRDHTAATASLRVVCASELASACDAIATIAKTTVEPAGVTAVRLETATGDPGLDAWLVPGPWPAIVDAARVRNAEATLFARSPSLASTRIGLAIFPERRVALEAKVGAPLTWKALGTAAKAQTWKALGGHDTWGLLKIGIDNPTTSASGLAALGGAAAGYFGRTAVTSTDLDDEAFRDWLAAIAHAVPTGTSLASMVSIGPSVLDADAGLEADLAPRVESSARSQKPDVIYPSPVAVVDVVLGETKGAPVDEAPISAKAVSALKRSGWTVPGDPDSLPAPGALDALRTAWQDASR